MIFPSTLRRMVIALNGYTGPEYFQAGDSLCYPGYVVMHDDSDEVKICTTTGKPIGIVGCDADHDLATVYTSGERIPVYPLGCGVDIYVASRDTTTVTVEKGSIMDTQDGDTTMIGKIKVKDAFIEVTTTIAANMGTERNLGTAFWVGHAIDAGAITSAISRYIPVKLSL